MHDSMTIQKRKVQNIIHHTQFFQEKWSDVEYISHIQGRVLILVVRVEWNEIEKPFYVTQDNTVFQYSFYAALCKSRNRNLQIPEGKKKKRYSEFEGRDFTLIAYFIHWFLLSTRHKW